MEERILKSKQQLRDHTKRTTEYMLMQAFTLKDLNIHKNIKINRNNCIIDSNAHEGSRQKDEAASWSWQL
jgi:hypothetical protein